LALSRTLAKDLLLIEDLPNIGKTTLVHPFAKLLGLDVQHIQFTSDLRRTRLSPAKQRLGWAKHLSRFTHQRRDTFMQGLTSKAGAWRELKSALQNNSLGGFR
jgi:hypothetical protein